MNINLERPKRRCALCSTSFSQTVLSVVRPPTLYGDTAVVELTKVISNGLLLPLYYIANDKLISGVRLLSGNPLALNENK